MHTLVSETIFDIPTPPPAADELVLLFSFTKTQILQFEWIEAGSAAPTMPGPERLFSALQALSDDTNTDNLAYRVRLPQPVTTPPTSLKLKVAYRRDPPVLSAKGVVWTSQSHVLLDGGWLPKYHKITENDLAQAELTPEQALKRREQELLCLGRIDPMIERTMRLFFEIERTTYPSAHIIGPHAATFRAAAAHLESQMLVRLLCHPRQPCPHPPNISVLPDDTLELVADRLRTAFDRVLRCVDATTLDPIVFAFVMGDARPFPFNGSQTGNPTDFRLEAMGAPNGIYYLLFAEAGLKLLDRGFDPRFWQPFTRSFLWTVSAFDAKYWNGTSRVANTYSYRYARCIEMDEVCRLYNERLLIRTDATLAELQDVFSRLVHKLLQNTSLAFEPHTCPPDCKSP